MDYPNNIYLHKFPTAEGKRKLARIVRDARGLKTLREFETHLLKVYGKKLSFNAIAALEDPHNNRTPTTGTLDAIAPATGYSAEELAQILVYKPDLVEEEIKKYQTYEDLLPLARAMPKSERVLLIQALVAEL